LSNFADCVKNLRRVGRNFTPNASSANRTPNSHPTAGDAHNRAQPLRSGQRSGKDFARMKPRSNYCVRVDPYTALMQNICCGGQVEGRLERTQRERNEANEHRSALK